MASNGSQEVTYVDGDGERHQAIILEQLPDDDYVTLARPIDGVDDVREEYVGTGWEIETSVYPHESTEFSGTTSDTYAYIPGWPEENEGDGWEVTD